MNYKNEQISLYNHLPSNVNFFKEETICSKLNISENNPDIEDICDVLIFPKIINTKLIKTSIGISNEGQNLTGNKLFVELSINLNVRYISNQVIKNICFENYEIKKNAYISLPEIINEKHIMDIFKLSRVNVTPFVEHYYTRLLDSRSFSISMLLLLDVKSY